jgi:hypothetical protein
MTRPPLLDSNRSYSFSNYFDLGIAVDDLVQEFGYGLTRQILTLPQYPGPIDFLDLLEQQILGTLPFVDLANEATRREILIAPVISTLVRNTQANLRIEYSLKVSQYLQGNLDYYLWAHNNLLVIEAKQADLNRGFTQLAAELIAMDEWSTSTQETIVGAITTGNLWQFGLLQRPSKQIIQGINSYRVPEDLTSLLRVLMGALTA